ncbi:hypothetical protein BJX96DRAFT_155951 [Aspergillus floccosus]
MAPSSTRIEHYTTDARVHSEGYHVKDWPNDNLIGYREARDRIYRQLLKKPDAALVQDGDRWKQVRDHGTDYKFTGRYTSENTKLEHIRHEQNLVGRFMKWEGDRWHKYDFEVAVKPHGSV